jgi:hypothetical protein
VFTLFIVPSIYMLVARTRARVVEATSDDELAAPNGAAGLQPGRSRADLKVGPSIA